MQENKGPEKKGLENNELEDKEPRNDRPDDKTRQDLDVTISLLDDLTLIEAAARKAGQIALQYFNQNPDVWFKGQARSPVSEADIAVDQFLKDYLLKARPDYGWLSEETEDNDARLSKEFVFVVDPIDGTRAYIAGTDEWCVAIAIVHSGRPVCGVLYAPVREQCYRAFDNGGAFLNNVRLSLPKIDQGLKNVIVPQEVTKRVKSGFDQKIKRVPGERSLALRLAGLANNRVDGLFVRKNSCDWDLAAADLIITEAGYRMTDDEMRDVVYNRPETRHGLLFAAHPSYIANMVAALL